MKRREDAMTRFIGDTVGHVMRIHMDNGVYRHIEFSRPGTSCYRFDITTWPGYLCVSGDMGTWTFSRLYDMFDFFGGWSGDINLHYWSEKLEAGAGSSARDLLAQEYDHEAFCRSLKESLSAYLEESEEEQSEDEDWDDEDDTPDSDKARVREAVRELCRCEFNNDWEAYQAVYEVDWPDDWSAWDICDGLTFKTYTHHFCWILHAIVWGITRYYNTRVVDKAMATFLAFRQSTSTVSNDEIAVVTSC
ncbi:hypothetical protein [Escherichia coli]|uniref:hypothetical protein n=1 Tax=Escherichia coli TaxID=562 RepID=UPI000A186493|nr:hypothetical protein [Escherichia coli]OSK33768.1 hypothetical protein EAHG_05008 [Escherichia coli B671]